MKHRYLGVAKQFCMMGILASIFVLSAKASEITANDFRNSRFRGFNLDAVHSGARSSIDLDALAKTGANMARVGVSLQRCALCTSYELSQTDLVTLDSLIHELAARSVYVTLVLVPMADARGPFWTSPSLQRSFIEHWKVLATRYRNLASIAGFDLLNEPVPPGRTYEDRQIMWLDFAERLGKEIRSVDPNRVLIVESAPDATTSSFNNMKTLPLENVVYSVHAYAPFDFTHQEVVKQASTPMSYGSSSGMDVNRQELYKLLAVVEAFSSKYNVPILVGEFSCVRWAPNASAERYISDSTDFFEEKGWSWMYHDFRGWPGWDAEMTESRFPTARSVDAPVMKILRAKMANNK